MAKIVDIIICTEDFEICLLLEKKKNKRILTILHKIIIRTSVKIIRCKKKKKVEEKALLISQSQSIRTISLILDINTKEIFLIIKTAYF